MRIYDLKVNRMKNPVGLGTGDLQFSFKAAGGEKFIVNLYREENGVFLHSQEIPLDEALSFYLSCTFEPGCRYKWNVQCGDTSSPFSLFETAALLDAPFITPSMKIPCPVLGREFSSAPVKKARLYITGLGLYRAFLNGVRIGDSYLTPYFNDYDGYLRYQTYDITDLVKEKNSLVVMLGDGWYKGRMGFDSDGSSTWGDAYLLCAKILLEQHDGSAVEILSDENWYASSSVIGESSIYDGEKRDDRKAASPKEKCRIERTGYNLVPDFSPPVRKKMEIKPTLIISPHNEQILDFGQNMVGFCRFRSRLSKGDSVRFQYGETLQDGCFYRKNLRTAKAEYSYVSDGRESDIEPYFTFYGFRYMKITGMEQVDPDDFTGVVLYTDLEKTLEVQSGNGKINRLMENALWGQRGNFLDVPTDCPQRDERLGWTADTQVFVNTACYHMDCFSFYRKYMKDLRVDQLLYYKGDIPMYSPSLKGHAGPGGAVWADGGTIIPWNVFMAYGDRQLLGTSYPMMRDYVETLIAKDASSGGRRLIAEGFTFGDWLAQDGVCSQALFGGTDNTFIRSIYYLNSLKLTARAAEQLNCRDDQSRYEKLAQEVGAALVDEYFSPSGRLALDTQTSYVLALHFGIHREKSVLVESLKKRLQKDSFKMKTGFAGTSLLLSVLFENGMEDYAYRILFNEECPGWLYAVNLGATTIWERWNSLLPDGKISGTVMNSLNHYAYGSVCESIYAHIAGLQCMEPGWKKARIAPKPNYRLKEMRIAFESPRGRFSVEWKVGGKGLFLLSVEIPHGTSAEILLPCSGETGKTVSAGKYSFKQHLASDYLHPYSKKSFILDLLKNEEANKAIKEMIPHVYTLISGENEEFMTWRLEDLGPVLIFSGTPEEIDRVDPVLKSITV